MSAFSSSSCSSDSQHPSSLPPLLPMDHPEFISTHRGPIDESNWLIPQRVLMSAYPGDLKPQVAQQKIETLIQRGINCFVCLQTENELKRFHPYRPLIEKFQVTSEKVLNHDESYGMIQQELSCSSSTNPTRSNLGANSNPTNSSTSSSNTSIIEYLHFPIQDAMIASDTQVMKFVQQDLIPRIVSNHHCKILIHCWGGHGRTGTIASILLSHLYQLNAEESLQRVAKCHKCRARPRGRAPTTEVQFQQVRRLCVGSKELQNQEIDDMA
nr:unnamed protein product [Naegleria fowleri]